MSNQDRINELTRELDIEKQKQSNCRHTWSDPFQKQFTEKEEVGTGQYEEHGVDRWEKTTFRDKPVTKWVRKCTACGLEQVTEKIKVVKTITAPDFGN
jgi:hypothetical protein